MAGPRRHLLSNIDPDARTADCFWCGRVRIHKAGAGFRCARLYRENGSNRVPGLNLVIADRLLAFQGDMCAICGDSLDVPHLDHCHKTHTVRGFLCRKCNVGLGFFRDNPDYLRRAITYLSQPPMASLPRRGWMKERVTDT